ncbi:hypothetical protein NX059_004715 [Plenodomus lindquistii]|nr:hypothetical protein NX059_004715 [Plenodomus lindquistii]
MAAPLHAPAHAQTPVTALPRPLSRCQHREALRITLLVASTPLQSCGLERAASCSSGAKHSTCAPGISQSIQAAFSFVAGLSSTLHDKLCFSRYCPSTQDKSQQSPTDAVPKHGHLFAWDEFFDRESRPKTLSLAKT